MEISKIEVPQFVNEWFLKNVNKNGLYELVKKLIDSADREEEYVYKWFKQEYDEAPYLEDEILFTLSNMAQFGYEVIPMYYIQFPREWDANRILYMQYFPFQDCYLYTSHIEKATKFTKEKALEVNEKLKIDWDLVEVEWNEETKWNENTTRTSY